MKGPDSLGNSIAPNGDQGPLGSDGQSGAKGLDGPQGELGSKGEPGEQGKRGENGRKVSPESNYQSNFFWIFVWYIIYITKNNFVFAKNVALWIYNTVTNYQRCIYEY